MTIDTSTLCIDDKCVISVVLVPDDKSAVVRVDIVDSQGQSHERLVVLVERLYLVPDYHWS